MRCRCCCRGWRGGRRQDTISGTITDGRIYHRKYSGDGKRFIGTIVFATRLEDISGTTSASGGYSLAVPDAGPYKLEFVDAVTPHRYHGEYYDDMLTFNTSAYVSIPEGQSNVVANAQLTAIQPITGHVTDEAGNPLEGIRVSTFYQAGNPQLEHQFWAPATNRPPMLRVPHDHRISQPSVSDF